MQPPWCRKNEKSLAAPQRHSLKGRIRAQTATAGGRHAFSSAELTIAMRASPGTRSFPLKIPISLLKNLCTQYRPSP